MTRIERLKAYATPDEIAQIDAAEKETWNRHGDWNGAQSELKRLLTVMEQREAAKKIEDGPH